MAGSSGPATIVVAQPDANTRELVARVLESAGHHVVRLADATAPELVEATVQATALVAVVDTACTSLDDVAAATDAFGARGYPARTLALVDGPATADSARAKGAAATLCRPFHQRDLLSAVALVLDPDRAAEQPEHARSGSDTPPPVRPLDAGSGHQFTDILRMGRQI